MALISQDLEEEEFETSPLSLEELACELIDAKKEGFWHLKKSGIYAARNLLKEYLVSRGDSPEQAEAISKGAGTTIALVNSGVDLRHPHLRDRFQFFKGLNFLNSLQPPTDENGHGTSIAGILCGEVTGVAPYANLISLKVCAGKAVNLDALGDALVWCTDHKQDHILNIINLSLSGSWHAPVLEQMLRKVYGSGISVVSAAGNTAFGKRFPGGLNEVVSAAASYRGGRHCKFSAVYNGVDVTAPGAYVMTITRCPSGSQDPNYAFVKGTSAAAAIVTGLLAIGIAYLKHVGHPVMSADIKALLKDTAIKPHLDSWNTACAEKLIKEHRISNQYPSIGKKEVLQWMYGAGHINGYAFIKRLLSTYPSKNLQPR